MSTSSLACIAQAPYAAASACGAVKVAFLYPESDACSQVKSVALLKEADCVVHDALIPEEALAYCQTSAEVLSVGKRGGRPSMKQPDIDALLVRKCEQHGKARAYTAFDASVLHFHVLHPAV